MNYLEVKIPITATYSHMVQEKNVCKKEKILKIVAKC